VTDHKYEMFDRSLLEIKPLTERHHDLDIADIKQLKRVDTVSKDFIVIASKIKAAISQNSSVILMIGGHVIRAGVQRYLIDLMEKGYISCLAMNGSGVIHDFEFALIGATTESVARYIQEGQFGLWQETGRICDIVSKASITKRGLGEAVGKVIYEEMFPYKEISLLAAGYRLGIPITVHVGIGYDIIHEHPNCDGAAFGAASYIDFLRFTKILENLEGGVVINFGSAVMAPEVFLKGLAMVRNVARQKGQKITHFTTLVCDLKQLPATYKYEASCDDPAYYFRPWKTMLVRTVADGGESYYIQGKHSETIPQLWTSLCQID